MPRVWSFADFTRSGVLLVILLCALTFAFAQTPPSSMFSNLANPAIGMNALFSGQAGQHQIMPTTLGNSAPMAEGSPFFLFMTGIEILRSRAPLGGQSLNRDMEQEVQCS